MPAGNNHEKTRARRDDERNRESQKKPLTTRVEGGSSFPVDAILRFLRCLAAFCTPFQIVVNRISKRLARFVNCCALKPNHIAYKRDFAVKNSGFVAELGSAGIAFVFDDILHRVKMQIVEVEYQTDIAVLPFVGCLVNIRHALEGFSVWTHKINRQLKTRELTIKSRNNLRHTPSQKNLTLRCLDCMKISRFE